MDKSECKRILSNIDSITTNEIDKIFTNHLDLINKNYLHKFIVKLCLDNKIDLIIHIINFYHEFIDINYDIDMIKYNGSNGTILEIYIENSYKVNHDIIKLFLNEYPEISENVVNDIVFKICNYGNCELLYLLQNYYDITFTSLHVNNSIYGNNIDLLKYLVTQCCEQIILSCIHCENKSIIKFICDNDFEFKDNECLNNFFCDACRISTLDVVITLLNKYPGIDIHYQKNCILICTLIKNNYDVAKYLLENYDFYDDIYRIFNIVLCVIDYDLFILVLNYIEDVHENCDNILKNINYNVKRDEFYKYIFTNYDYDPTTLLEQYQIIYNKIKN